MIIDNTLPALTPVLIELGVHPGDFAKKLGFPEIWLYDPDAIISANEYARVFNKAVEHCDCRNLGLLMSRHNSWANLRQVWRHIRKTTTVRQSLEALVAYFDQFSTDIGVQLENDGEFTALHYDPMSWVDESVHMLIEQGHATTVRDLRSVLGQSWQPVMTQFRHSAPRDMTMFHQAFGDYVLFDQDRNALIFDEETLDRSIDWGGSCSDGVQSLPSRMRAKRYPPLYRIEIVIRQLLPNGECNLNGLANYFEINPRSFQRHLTQQQRTYQDILDDVRLDLAKGYLKHSNLKIGQIAELLQFSGSSSLTRFLLAKTGHTPKQFRNLAD